MAEKKRGSKLNVAIIHPDLGVGNFFFFSFPSVGFENCEGVFGIGLFML